MKISLRPLKSSDIDAFLTWATDEEVVKSLTWNAYTDRESAIKFLREVVENHPFFMAICLDNVVIGSITLESKKDKKETYRELGYVLAKKYWGKGFMTSAVNLATECGFKKFNLEIIEAYVDPDNISSMRVLEKAHFKRGPLLKDYIKFKNKMRDRVVFFKN